MGFKEVRMLGRYILLVLLALGNLYLFYIIFTPLTVYPVSWILHQAYGAVLLEGNVLFLNGHYVEIITACIAGAAYYLLVILNLTTPMNFRKRLVSLAFLLLAFLILNILRIIAFAALLESGSLYFNLAHEAVWYFGSTLLVIFIWFANILIFRIRGIPVYSDVMYVINSAFAHKPRHHKEHTHEAHHRHLTHH